MERSRTHTGDLEKSAKQVEELHESEKAALRAAERELVSLKEKIFKQSEVLGAARREEANIEAEISGADRSSRNATYRIKQLDEQAQRQRELVYSADFQLQLMERKVNPNPNPNPNPHPHPHPHPHPNPNPNPNPRWRVRRASDRPPSSASCTKRSPVCSPSPR